MSLPAAYVGLLQILTKVANDNGYAIGLHGSLNRDMDIIACPWTGAAIEPQDLIIKLAQSVLEDIAHRITHPRLKPLYRCLNNAPLIYRK